MNFRACIQIGWFFCACLTLFVGCSQPMDPQAARIFQEAQREFDTAEDPEDFLRAAALYQEIIDSGSTSGAVLFNQGNAFMQAGERGRAIAAYRQAQRYRPRDPYLDANLNLALEAEPGRGSRRSMLEYVLFWQRWLGYPAKFHAVATFAGTAFVFGVAALVWRRRWLNQLAIAALGITLLGAVSAAYDWYRFDHLVHGVVVQDRVIARKGNAASYKPAFTEPLDEGTEFQLVNGQGDWLRVRLAGDQECWIPEQAAVLY